MGERDSSEALARMALEKSAQASTDLQALAYFAMAEHHLLFMEYDSAWAYANPFPELPEIQDFKRQKIRALWLQGILHFKKLDLEASLIFCEKGLAAAREAGDKQLEAKCLACVASSLRTYHNTPEYVQSIKDFEEALTIFESVKDTAGIISTLLTLTDIYRSDLYEGQFDEKMNACFERAKLLLEEYPHELLKVSMLNLSGALHEMNGQYEAAFQDWTNASDLAEKMGLGYMVQHINFQISAYHKDRQDYNKALLALDKAIAAYPGYIHDGGASMYAAIYEEMGDYKKALEYTRYALEANDSQRVAQQSGLVAEWEARFNLQEQQRQLQQNEKEIKFEKLKGRLFLFSTILFLLLAALLVFGIFREKKARKILSQQNEIIEKQAEKLRHLDQVKSRFFANVSHELRTPLTLILGPIDSALKSQTLGNRNFTFLKMAQQNAHKLLQLVSEILDLSKMESGKMELNEEIIELLPFLKRQLSQFESHARQQGKELSFDFLPSAGLKVKLDAPKMETILNNLLSNALKFTHAGDKINVRLEDTGNSLELMVADTGEGIHSDDLPHVFDRYYQSKQPDAPAQGGTGIGLALSQELANKMEGSISVQSTLGEGTTFVVSWPKKEVLVAAGDVFDDTAAQQLAAHSSRPEMIAELKTDEPSDAPTLLLVEDNHTLRAYLKTILSPYYQLLTAENGQVALDLITESYRKKETSNLPDLIISDVMMPVMDGYQLLAVLKSKDYLCNIPVIMLTAKAGLQDKLKALRIGVDDYMLKPFEEEELLVRVENLLKNYQERKDALESERDTPEAPQASEEEKMLISAEDQQWLQALEQHLSTHLSNSQYTIGQLAGDMALSERQLRRRIRQLTGLTPVQYFKEIRLLHGRRLLENRAYKTVAQVATAAGFQDAGAFSRNFSQRFGKTPSDYLSH